MLNLDAADTQRLNNFCLNLPELPADPQHAEQELRFTWACLCRRRDEVQAIMARGGEPGQGVELLRYEMDAINSAQKILGALWRRQFASELSLA